MNKLLSRRDVLKSFGAAGAGALLGAPIAFAQDATIRIAGRPVQITAASVSAQTVRISVVPIENGGPQPIPYDGSLVQQTWGPPSARFTMESRAMSATSSALTRGRPASSLSRIANAMRIGRKLEAGEISDKDPAAPRPRK